MKPKPIGKAKGTGTKTKLISLEQAERLSQKEIHQIYKDYVNPGFLKFLNLLGFSRLEPVKSEGCYIFTKSGRKILDFTGGRSVLGLGHNHPRLTKARIKFEQENRLVVWKDFLSPYLAALSHNLAQVCPGDLNYSFFCNSGAEANEGALKLAEKFQGKERDKIIAASNSYHGKTHATMAISGCEESKKYFKLLSGCIFVPYNDAKALENAIRSRCRKGTKENDVCAVILESVHAGNITIPKLEYLREVRRITEDYGIVLILDEVFTGFGKTGKMFAFEHSGIVPDIVSVSKTLGGGKATIAAYIARDNVFKKAYGDTSTALMHTTTYNGFGNECISAIEAINVLVEENLPERAGRLGRYLLSGLKRLKEKHPAMIKDVRGIGTICGIEFHQYMPKATGLLKKRKIFLGEMLDNYATGAVISELLFNHGILTFISPHYPGLLHVQPPMVAGKKEVDQVLEALDSVCSKGFTRLGMGLAKRMLKKQAF